jgi:hypothetical protein
LDENLGENKQLIKGFIFEKYYGQISANPLAVPATKGEKNCFL